MTYVSTHHHPSTFQDDISIDRTQSIITKFAYSIGHWFRRVSRRRYLATLGQMSDQQLLDIGLYYEDIVEAATLGYHRDVTSHLADIARNRRNISVQSAA